MAGFGGFRGLSGSAIYESHRPYVNARTQLGGTGFPARDILPGMRLLAIHAALLGLLGLMTLSAPASAELPEVRRHGEFCPPAGCAGSRRSSASSSLGFAAVVLASGLIARRGATTAR